MSDELIKLDAYNQALKNASEARVEIPESIKTNAELERMAAIRTETEYINARAKSKGRFQRLVDSWLDRYPHIQDGITKLGNLSIAMIKLFAVNVIASLIMFGVLIAEVTRVIVGLHAIEASTFAAIILSLVLVSLVFFLEFAAYYLEKEGNYTPPKPLQWSLRIVWRDLRYALGIGKDWTEREISPAKRVLFAKWIIQLSVAFIALYGSMAHAIEQHSGSWLSALWSILTASSLKEMSAWNIGFWLTVAILSGAAVMSHFVASRAKYLEDSTFAVGEDKIGALAVERAANVITTYYKEVIHQRRIAQQTALQALQAPQPAALPPSVPLMPNVQPAVLPRHNSGAIPIKPLSDDSPDDQTDTRQIPDKAKGVKAALVRRHYTDNPTDLSVDVRTIAAKLGIGKDTVNTVRREFDRQTDK